MNNMDKSDITLANYTDDIMLIIMYKTNNLQFENFITVI